jgi:hypothetical protein
LEFNRLAPDLVSEFEIETKIRQLMNKTIFAASKKLTSEMEIM